MNEGEYWLFRIIDMPELVKAKVYKISYEGSPDTKIPYIILSYNTQGFFRPKETIHYYRLMDVIPIIKL